MGAKALFRGAGHVFVAIDDEMARLVGRDVLGLPAREAITDVEYAPSQRLMDVVFRTGRPHSILVASVEGVPGIVVIEPVIRQGRVWGVVTEWMPLAATVPTPGVQDPAPAQR